MFPDGDVQGVAWPDAVGIGTVGSKSGIDAGCSGAGPVHRDQLWRDRYQLVAAAGGALLVVQLAGFHVLAGCQDAGMQKHAAPGQTESWQELHRGLDPCCRGTAGTASHRHTKTDRSLTA